MENILNSTRVTLTPSSLSLLLHACKAVLDPGASCSRIPAHHAGDGDGDGISAHHAGDGDGDGIPAHHAGDGDGDGIPSYCREQGVVSENYDILRSLLLKSLVLCVCMFYPMILIMQERSELTEF